MEIDRLNKASGSPVLSAAEDLDDSEQQIHLEKSASNGGMRLHLDTIEVEGEKSAYVYDESVAIDCNKFMSQFDESMLSRLFYHINQGGLVHLQR